MLKLNASYAKKIPVEGQEFSSQSFHASVELELSDSLAPEELRHRIHDTFTLVRQSVEAELNGKQPAAGLPAAPTPIPVAQATKPAATTQPVGKASNKQIKFIMDLVTQAGFTLSQLNEQVQRLYGVPTLYDLNRKQASALLDSLQSKKAA